MECEILIAGGFIDTSTTCYIGNDVEVTANIGTMLTMGLILSLVVGVILLFVNYRFD